MDGRKVEVDAEVGVERQGLNWRMLGVDGVMAMLREARGKERKRGAMRGIFGAGLGQWTDTRASVSIHSEICTTYYSSRYGFYEEMLPFS